MGGPVLLHILMFGSICLAGVVFVSYEKFAKVLKFGTLVLLVYVIVAFAVHAPAREILAGSFIPEIRLGGGYMTALTAVLGTTISPYLFFWQASQEVEEQKNTPGEKPLKKAPARPRGNWSQCGQILISEWRFRTSSRISSCWIPAPLLHAHGITHIETATQAAEALRPVGGEFTFLLFAIGIIGTGLLAVPVLAGSVGYALAENCPLAVRPREEAGKRPGLLWNDRRGNPARTGAESNLHQSHQGAFLERGEQWPVRRTDHGPGHADDD